MFGRISNHANHSGILVERNLCSNVHFTNSQAYACSCNLIFRFLFPFFKKIRFQYSNKLKYNHFAFVRLHIHGSIRISIEMIYSEMCALYTCNDLFVFHFVLFIIIFIYFCFFLYFQWNSNLTFNWEKARFQSCMFNDKKN